MAKNAGELKKRCWLAKQRLKMGYWESASHADGIAPAPARPAAEYTRLMRMEPATARAEDERMYQKVCDILDSSEVALDPIGRLIERDVYDRLDPDGKQRYVLQLSQKFRELQERYYREKANA